MTKMKNVNLYNQDGSLHADAQQLLSLKPDKMSNAEWRKRTKNFTSTLSEEDVKEFNRIRRKHWQANWLDANPKMAEKARQRSINWHIKNPGKQQQINRDLCAQNPEKVKQATALQNAKWRAENPKYGTAYLKVYHKQRRAKDPLYRLQCNMRNQSSRVVRQLALGKKPTSTYKWVGCSAEELKSHLESLFVEGMTWDNYGKWHVDHVRPVSSFAAEEWEQINHYTNLQPLWAEDNIKKGDSW